MKTILEQTILKLQLLHVLLGSGPYSTSAKSFTCPYDALNQINCVSKIRQTKQARNIYIFRNHLQKKNNVLIY